MTSEQQKDLLITMQRINHQKLLKQQDEEYAEALRAKFSDKQ